MQVKFDVMADFQNRFAVEQRFENFADLLKLKLRHSRCLRLAEQIQIAAGTAGGMRQRHIAGLSRRHGQRKADNFIKLRIKPVGFSIESDKARLADFVGPAFQPGLVLNKFIMRFNRLDRFKYGVFRIIGTLFSHPFFYPGTNGVKAVAADELEDCRQIGFLAGIFFNLMGYRHVRL